MLPVIKNNTKATYLDIWKIILMNEHALKECKNSLMIPELLLINPFSNAKLESHIYLDVLVRINNEGPDVANFDAKESIDHWFDDRVRRLTRKRLNHTSLVDITMLVLSDLEDEESSTLAGLF